MNTVTKMLLAVCLALSTTVIPALAAGPIDGEVSAVWWANDYRTKSPMGDASSGAGAAGLRAQLWMFERYGVQASQFGSDPQGSDGADYTSVDLMWRAFSPTENNFLAVGLGWEQMSIDGLDDDASGMRVSVQGRVGIVGMLYAYGEGAYLPSLGDVNATDAAAGSFRDLDAYEYELGLAWNALPFMNVHAGYRLSSLGFSQEGFEVASVPAISRPAVGMPGNGMLQLGEGRGSSGCTGCAPAATSTAGNGEAESSGFFVGLGFQF